MKERVTIRRTDLPIMDEQYYRERDAFLEFCSDHRTVDAHWSAFVRMWRSIGRTFLPPCSRNEP